MLDSKCLPIPIKSSVTQLLHFYVLLLQTDIKFVPSLRINSFVADSQSRIYCRQPDQVVSWILCMNMLHWNTPETALTAPPPPSPPPPQSNKKCLYLKRKLSVWLHPQLVTEQTMFVYWRYGHDDMCLQVLPLCDSHIPTLYCYTTYCAHWHNWIV